MKQPSSATCIIGLMLWSAVCSFLHAETPAQEPPGPLAEQANEDAPPQSMRDALDRLELPGIKINLDAWSVDVDATVSLDNGLLELIACTKDTKEHESVVAVNAKPSHIHAALLLIGATPGNPAMRKIVGEGEDTRFIDIPPRGGMIDVYLVIDEPEGKKEYPINQFIQKSSNAFDYHGAPDEEAEQELILYPTHEFMFTGSVLVERGEDQPRQYIADYSGNVISIVTFGDEMLSTPNIHDDSNDSLVWEVRDEKLPALDSPVILRLKPHRPEPLPQGDKQGNE